MKCLEIARLQDFAPNTQGLLGALSGPQTPCRIERTPLWKFLPTGLNHMAITEWHTLYHTRLTKNVKIKWYWTPPFSIIWCNFFRNKNQIISSHIFSIWRSPMKTQNHIKMTIYKRKNCLLIKNVATNRFPLMSY